MIFVWKAKDILSVCQEAFSAGAQVKKNISNCFLQIFKDIFRVLHFTRWLCDRAVVGRDSEPDCGCNLVSIGVRLATLVRPGALCHSLPSLW